MLLRHDWVTPQLNGSAYLNKPPLFYWMIAGSYSIWGVNEWAARFPLALVAWLGVVLAWKWARELWGAPAGRAAAGILGVSAGWYLFSHQLLIDELLSVLHLAGLYCLWKCVTRPERGVHWVAFYFTLALSILAKGLVGPALLLAVLFSFAALKKDRSSLRNSRPLLGLLIIVAVAVPWVVLVEVRNPGFLRYVIFNEHIDRIIDRRWPPDYEVSKTSAPMFLLASLIWLAPWSFFLPQIVSFAARNASRWSGVDRSLADAVSLLSLGALLPTLLFVPVPSRLIYYCLPGLPPFAVLASGWWVSMDSPSYRRGRKIAALTALCFGVSIGIAGFLIGAKLSRISDLAAAPQTLDYIPGFALAIGAGLAGCGVLLLLRKTGAALLLMCLAIGIGEACNTAGFAAFDRVRSSKRMVAEILPHTKPNWIWVSEGSLEIGAAAGTAFYLGEDDDGIPRSVLVMEDSPNRKPPRFPGRKAAYLIDRSKLEELWKGSAPVLYITDFLRTDWERDPPSLPPGERHEIQLKDAGHRKVYANDAAWRAGADRIAADSK
jgi:4-amino-4-deoxy-L-arabinose transferase-like glycosyltransferase